MSIIIKCVFNGDLRRFSIPKRTTFIDFRNLLTKLYAVPNNVIDQLKLQYKDEEGDVITISSDQELVEAMEHAEGNILRILVSTGQLTASQFAGSSAFNSVYVNNSQPIPSKTNPPFNPSAHFHISTPSVPQSTVIQQKPPKPSYDSSVPSSSININANINIPEVVSTTLDNYKHLRSEDLEVSEVMDSSLVPSTATLTINTTANSGPVTTTTTTTVSPILIKSPTNLSALTASIAESISNIVLESSEAALRNTYEVSNAVLRDTLIASQVSAPSEKDIASNNELHELSKQTCSVTSRETQWATTSVHLNSREVSDLVGPASQHTLDIQNEATRGMEDAMERQAAEMLRTILKI